MVGRQPRRVHYAICLKSRLDSLSKKVRLGHGLPGVTSAAVCRLVEVSINYFSRREILRNRSAGQAHAMRSHSDRWNEGVTMTTGRVVECEDRVLRTLENPGPRPSSPVYTILPRGCFISCPEKRVPQALCPVRETASSGPPPSMPQRQLCPEWHWPECRIRRQIVDS